jgi:hypothetical protein
MIRLYRVINKSLRDFRPLPYSSWDGHSEGAHVNRGRDSNFLSYLTGARYVHPWWRCRCQSCNQIPTTRGKSRCIEDTYARTLYATWFTATATKDRGSSRCYQLPDVTCVAGTWLQDWHLLRHQGWTYRVPVKVQQKLRVPLPLLTCSPSAWPSRLLYRRGRKSRRDLWITLYLAWGIESVVK